MHSKSTKKFGVSNSDLLIVGRNFASMIMNDLHEFTAFSSYDFHADFPKTFGQLIDDGHAFPTDDHVRLEIKKRKDETDAADKKLRNAFSHTRFHIENHLSDDPHTQRQLGVGTFSEQVSSTDTLILFMVRFNTAVLPYKSKLIETGLPESQLTNLVNLTEAVNKARNEHLEAAKERIIKTEQRTVLMNTIWDEMSKISSAEKKMKTGSGAPLRYNLPYTKKTDKTDPKDETAS